MGSFGAGLGARGNEIGRNGQGNGISNNMKTLRRPVSPSMRDRGDDTSP